ncbi:NAD-dependent epimerase/dehydratase family protein [Clostridium sp. 3-3]|uniref:NAD-dependent epimerase/dehydratase family protein n=1 Tax=Clostridium sp. 3-3 TaxID=2070757 RepID=UPI000CDA0CF8|nr:NAD-dependent epimerase/dehydratase family protein [Clostridium sp. 3-3]POO85652.1 epimerase [Clostridium sp. 3-3]
MKIIIIGAAGFIGTNLALALSKSKKNEITLIDVKYEYFPDEVKSIENVKIIESNFSDDTDFDSLIKNQDIVYHLVSTTVPSTSNQHIASELHSNIIVTTKLLNACVEENVKKVIFLSSGGTVYGKEISAPIKEIDSTKPISSYGLQKLTIENLLYLYNYLYNLDYSVIRLANPYGPFQRPNGSLGAVTTFTYKALKNEEISVYGDGSVVRDFIYIDDAINAIIKIANSVSKHKIFNVGSGCGTSINELIHIIEKTLNRKLNVKYIKSRNVDVPINYLDISRYEEEFGQMIHYDIETGIRQTAKFLSKSI